jgi:putative iron-regulated protein
MKKTNLFKLLAVTAVTSLSLYSCQSDDSSNDSSSEKNAVVENYASIVYSNYLQSYNDAVVLETAINAFTANPSQALFDTAKTAWKTARESYNTTEAFRFIDGPIDDANGPEAFLNAWPLDENFIDYVDGAASSGIINNTVEYPTLSKALLESLNEEGGEKNISIGYHAIEFLLWGQDLTVPSANLAGQRPYTDFVDGGSALNQDRRREYLNICADLLTDHLDYLVDQWKPSGAYRSYFLTLDKDEAIKRMLKGAIVLVYSELAIERIDVALYNQDQEDEHSCFSDNTHRDIRLNLEGVVNVYNGTYQTTAGASLADLVRAVNPTVAADIDAALEDAVAKTEATFIPFDIAISEGPTSVEGAKVKAAVTAMQLAGSNLIAGASSLGITIE